MFEEMPLYSIIKAMLQPLTVHLIHHLPPFTPAQHLLPERHFPIATAHRQDVTSERPRDAPDRIGELRRLVGAVRAQRGGLPRRRGVRSVVDEDGAVLCRASALA